MEQTHRKSFGQKASMLIRKIFRMDLHEKRNMAGYLFVLPFVLGLALIFIPSLVETFVFSRNTIQLRVDGSGFDLIPKGWAHYVRAFSEDPNFRVHLLNSFKDMILNLPILLIFSFFMAILLNRNFPGRVVFRIIFFLPVILYTGVASDVAANASSGALGEVLAKIFADSSLDQGATGEMSTGIAALSQGIMSLSSIIDNVQLGGSLMRFIHGAISRLEWIIQTSGVQIIVFLSGLQGIPTSVFEAASVEGLTGWEMFWKITLPMVSPMILVNTIYTIVDSFNSDKYTVLPYIQSIAFNRPDYGFGSAMSFIYFVCVILLIGLLSAIISRFVFYQN